MSDLDMAIKTGINIDRTLKDMETISQYLSTLLWYSKRNCNLYGLKWNLPSVYDFFKDNDASTLETSYKELSQTVEKLTAEAKKFEWSEVLAEYSKEIGEQLDEIGKYLQDVKKLLPLSAPNISIMHGQLDLK